MTREELLEENKRLEERQREIRLELAKITKDDRQEANAKLANLVETIEGLLNDAQAIANEHHLEFSIEGGGMYVEFESYEYGNWAHSSC